MWFRLMPSLVQNEMLIRTIISHTKALYHRLSNQICVVCCAASVPSMPPSRTAAMAARTAA
jgi:hypothetical protein